MVDVLLKRFRFVGRSTLLIFLFDVVPMVALPNVTVTGSAMVKKLNFVLFQICHCKVWLAMVTFALLAETDEAQQYSKKKSVTTRNNAFFAISLIVCVAMLYRVTVAMTQAYSGHAIPPRFGDFEAQRHWMEITVNLHPLQWYQNSTENDLEYWGLDYPPLTAYHSWICGKIAQLIGWGEIVALHSSRGIETVRSKLFMRYTALAADLLIFVSAMVFFVWRYYQGRSRSEWLTILCMILLQPAFVLIDHGHFQFNSICLGLTLWAVNALLHDRVIFASILFSLSLNYKQMALYYSLPFFFYILRYCWEKPTFISKISTLIQVAISVLATFAACWAPWLATGDLSQVLQVVRRVFPFHRGLYEDKVANFWCSTSMAIKWHLRFTRDQLVVMTMAITLIACVPSCLYILFGRGHRIHRLLIGMVGCSFAFFMFSFHVHEKTILLPLLPVVLLMGDFDKAGLLVNWLGTVATFSMYPLFVKDEITPAYYASLLSFVILTLSVSEVNRKGLYIWKMLYLLSLAILAVIQAINSFITPPARYPDLHTYFCVMYSCLHFILGATYLIYQSMTADTKTDLKKE
jgi:alpha-1,3-glucosyltransferase